MAYKYRRRGKVYIIAKVGDRVGAFTESEWQTAQERYVHHRKVGGEPL